MNIEGDMGAPSATGWTITIEAVDVDDAEQAITETYLPARVHPPPGAKINMRLNAMQIGRVTVGRMRFAAAVRIVTGAPTNYHVDIPLSGQARSRAGKGDEVLSAPGSATVFMPGADVDMSWTDDTRQVCMMLGTDEVELELRRLLGREPTRPLVFEESMDLCSRGGRAWMQILDLIEGEAVCGTGLLSYRLTARRLEQLLIDGLLIGHRHNYTELLNGEYSTVSHRAARRAVDLLQERPEYPWTVSDLAAQVAVSVRSLHDGFRDLTGSAPMAYLQRLRLQSAHDDLLTADPHRTTVSHIAHMWGFLHLGRFASAYRIRFGELPRETLKRDR
jgi:AraC-like DNA-binding protein